MDLPANLNMPSAAALTVADRISDPMMPELDPSLLDFRPMELSFGSKQEDPLNWNSQLLSDPLSVELGRHGPPRDERLEHDEDDMSIDLDLDRGLDDGPSIEIGRNAPPPGTLEDDLRSEDDKLQGDFAYDENAQTRLSSRVPSLIDDTVDKMPDNGEVLLEDGNDFTFPLNDAADAFHAPADPRLQRASQSPLSSVRSSMLREFDAANIHEDEEEASMRRITHKAKKRKVIQADADTMLSSSQIKQQQADRSAILKPFSSLSRDPNLLSLMDLQKNGGFASSVMGDGRAQGWAPELRGILSIEVVRKAGQLKRKRDSGIADVEEEEAQADLGNMPQLEIPEDDDIFAATDEGLGHGGKVTFEETSDKINLPVDDAFPHEQDRENIAIGEREDEDEDIDAAGDRFDDTTAPLLHPMEQGAVSQGTKHAVHLLRDRFGPSADDRSSQQKKTSILFQDMLPESATSKADATKMFFEVLVLATKDAVKVEQEDQAVGSSLRITAKRSLWGDWAEREAGGEIAEKDSVPPYVVSLT